MSKLPLLTAIFTYIGCNCAITPAQAESINIQFTGTIPEHISVNISSPQPGEVAIANSSPGNMQIPQIPYLQTVQVNSSQPVNIILTSSEIPDRVIKNSSTGKTNLQLPLTNSSHFHITVVPQ